MHSNGLNTKDEKRGSIKKSSSSQLNVTSIVNINEKDEHMNSIIRYQTLHYGSNNKNSGMCVRANNAPVNRRFQVPKLASFHT